MFESPSHPDEAAALGGRRVCPLLQTPGKRHPYPACYGPRPECGSLAAAGADDRRNHRGIGPPDAALSAVKKMVISAYNHVSRRCNAGICVYLSHEFSPGKPIQTTAY